MQNWILINLEFHVCRETTISCFSKNVIHISLLPARSSAEEEKLQTPVIGTRQMKTVATGSLVCHTSRSPSAAFSAPSALVVAAAEVNSLSIAYVRSTGAGRSNRSSCLPASVASFYMRVYGAVVSCVPQLADQIDPAACPW